MEKTDKKILVEKFRCPDCHSSQTYMIKAGLKCRRCGFLDTTKSKEVKE